MREHWEKRKEEIERENLKLEDAKGTEGEGTVVGEVRISGRT